MNKATLLLLLIFTLIMTACSGNASNATAPAGNFPGGGAAGALSASIQVALGTIKLEGTENAITADQAKELLPLWETLQDLESSDTAATQEKEALVTQIQETMTTEQTQSITALNLSRQDMFSIMQSQGGSAFGGSQNGTTQNGSSSSSGRSTSGGGGFGPGGGFAGGPPPDGGFGPGGNPNGQRQQSNGSTDTTTRPTVDPNRIPTPLIQAVIEYLKTKAA